MNTRALPEKRQTTSELRPLLRRVAARRPPPRVGGEIIARRARALTTAPPPTPTAPPFPSPPAGSAQQRWRTPRTTSTWPSSPSRCVSLPHPPTRARAAPFTGGGVLLRLRPPPPPSPPAPLAPSPSSVPPPAAAHTPLRAPRGAGLAGLPDRVFPWRRTQQFPWPHHPPQRPLTHVPRPPARPPLPPTPQSTRPSATTRWSST